MTLLRKLTKETQSLSSELRDAIRDLASSLREQHSLETRRHVGEYVPECLLSYPVSIGSKPTPLAELLHTGPLVLTFYWGGWSPFCKAQLSALSNSYLSIQAFRGKLIALSPEPAEAAQTTISKHYIDFPVYEDRYNEIARRFCIGFQLPGHLYSALGGAELTQGHPTTSIELPLPATYVINNRGLIVYEHVNEDFTQRAPVREILTSLYDLRRVSLLS